MTGALLVLLLVLAAVLLGSLVPQGLQAEYYQELYGDFLGKLFLGLGLDDIFRTRGFIGLGVILFLQVLVCTCRRFLTLRRGMRTAAAGSLLLHAGLMLFLGSVGISLWWGRTAMLEAPEGRPVSLDIVGLPVEIRLDRFTIDYEPGGRAVRQYRSEVALLREGAEVRRAGVEVNSPLQYEDLKVYQMSFGWLIEGSVRVLPEGRAQPFSVRNGDWLPESLTGKTRLRLGVLHDPDREAGGRPELAFAGISASGTRLGGAGVPGETFVAGGLEIKTESLRRYSGLQVKRDPGVPGIFCGLALGLAGLILRYLPGKKKGEAC